MTQIPVTLTVNPDFDRAVVQLGTDLRKCRMYCMYTFQAAYVCFICTLPSDTILATEAEVMT